MLFLENILSLVSYFSLFFFKFPLSILAAQLLSSPFWVLKLQSPSGPRNHEKVSTRLDKDKKKMFVFVLHQFWVFLLFSNSIRAATECRTLWCTLIFLKEISVNHSITPALTAHNFYMLKTIDNLYANKKNKTNL